jgi:hypothetical protein
MASQRRLMQRVWIVASLPSLVVAALLGGGCASPDEPTARRIVVPQVIQDLQAHQQGGEVILSFTLPTQTTEKTTMAMPPAIEIYRGEIAGTVNAKAAAKTNTKPIYTIPSEMVDTYRDEGKIAYRDTVDGVTLADASGADVEWLYLVKTRVARNRASADSNRVVVRIRPTSQPVTNVSAKITGKNVTVIWPREPNSTYRVYRGEIAPESAAAAANDASKATYRMPLAQISQADSPNSGDAGQLQYQDAAVEVGHTYLYVVRRLARFGEESVESADSKPAIVTMVEVQPPKAPEDVQAVAFAATAPEPAYVSLSWAFGSEPGITGYAVFRSEQAGARGARLNAELLGAPAYRDMSVVGGRTYFYTVVAVDSNGQESAPSQEVEARVPVQP